ncbi:MAG: stage II sporulation protein M, partial [Anaerolineales bacterium]
FNNLRALLLAAVVAVFSFGALALILLMIPLALVGFFAVEVGLLGYNPWVFVLAFILPHGIVELPAAIIGTAFALRIGAALVSPPKGLDVGQGFLLVLADFCKVFFFLVVPLLLVGAFIEANLTPQIVLALYSGR